MGWGSLRGRARLRARERPRGPASATAGPREGSSGEADPGPRDGEAGCDHPREAGRDHPRDEAGRDGARRHEARGGDAQRQSEIYGDRIDGLSVEVDALKDKIFRSRARLSLLRETVLKGVLAGSRVVLAHRNLMGSGFRLTRIVISMDGAQIYAKTDESGGLDSEDELVIYD